MNTKPKDGGAAFPGQPQWDNGVRVTVDQRGMTLRDWFAGQALAGIVGQHIQGDSTFSRLTAKQAYEYADALLAARVEEGEKSE
jgi:hypothetical protein